MKRRMGTEQDGDGKGDELSSALPWHRTEDAQKWLYCKQQVIIENSAEGSSRWSLYRKARAKGHVS